MSGDRRSSSRSPVGTRGSNQHLWNVLQGRVVVATEDVVLEELRDCLDRIVNGLTSYAPYEEKDGEAEISFPSMPRFIRSAMTKASGERTDSGAALAGSSQDAKRASQTSTSSFDDLRKAIAQKLKLELNVATELLVSYMMYEYKGSSTSYDEITDTQRSFMRFLEDLREYYMRERICLLLCTQAILADLGDEEHRFFGIFETFRTMISYKDWCWGLLKSIDVAKDEAEIIEILHCLILMMYKLPNESISEFFIYFSNNGFSMTRKSERMKMAEGAAMYSALVVAGVTDCCSSLFPQEFSPIVKAFVSKNFENLLLNPYNIAPLFASYDIFCKDDQEITRKMRCLHCNPAVTFSCMLNLAENYGKNTLYDRHSLSLIVSASIFEAFESLLANYDINHFGTNTQGFLILSKILQHNLVAENFLCGTPLALTALYTDATSVFPLDIASTLHLWKSLCMSVRSKSSCKTLIKGVAKLNSIAEFVDEEVSLITRRMGDYGVVNLKTRTLYGVPLENGLSGTMNTYEDTQCISWELPSSMEVSAFDVILFIIKPIADHLQAMDLQFVPSSDIEHYDYCPKILHAVSEFIIEFMKSSDVQIDKLTYLIHPVCIVMEKLIKHLRDTEEKLKLVQNLMGIVGAINDFTTEKMALFSYIYDILPGSDSVSVVESMVLGRESVSMTKCDITLSFLDLMCGFAENPKCWNQGHESVFEAKFLKSIGFIAENILSSSGTWRVENEGIRYKMYLKCLEMFTYIYALEGRDWVTLKQECLRFLIAPNSCLIVALKTDENRLQDSVIRPTEDDKLLVDVVCTALKLLLQLIRFEKKFLMNLERILEGTFVRMLGRLARHRLNPTIPTLTMKILKEVAAKTTMSLLACFGNDEAAFRDVIIQRLEFTAEDVNLKIAVLEFLTVIAQTQVGIIQCFFTGGVLESSIIDLIEESEDLSVACLHFFRSLFKQGLPLPRSHIDFWSSAFTPINSIKRGSRLEIITATLHILTFELYTTGTSDLNFISELEQLLIKEKFQPIMEVVVADPNEVAVKCLMSLKHFLTLVLGRSELARLIPKDTVLSLQILMLETFWAATRRNPVDRPLCANLSELVTIVTTPESATPAFMSDLLLNLIETFSYHDLSVQLSLLCLINKCYKHCKEPLRNGVIENTMRILKKVLDSSMKIMQEMESGETLYSLLIVTSTVISTIIETQPIELWKAAFQIDMIPLSLLSISSLGITRRKAVDVVANCLATLITLVEHPHGSDLLPTTGMSKALWLHLSKFTEDPCDESWTNVFLLCLNLNSKLLGSQKHLYLDEALAFWGLYGSFLNQKLSLMTSLTEICVVIEDSDKCYNNMKAVLMCSGFVLNDILMLMSYLEEWQTSQPTEVFKAIRGVFFVLQEASSLLRQPLLLQSTIGYKSKLPMSEVKLSPKLLEMQTKLWEICDICIQILVKLKSKDDEFIEKNSLIPTMFQIGQLCIKALTKGDRKNYSGINVTNRVSSVLEKVMLIVHNYTMPILDDASVDNKFQISFRRELGTEVVSLCDGIRRLGVPKNEFLISLCSKIESKFK